ncbi:MAG TPA: hypothetical protein VMI53_14850 [Opitutaceae bacterium]|nr:hypothetical protein [Opitutaceae bacterium]
MPHPSSIRPDAYRPPTREEVERAREMYAQGFTVSRILAACDMSLGTFYYWLDGGPQAGPPSSLRATSGKPDVDGGPAHTTLYPPLPRRRRVVGKRRRPLPDASRVSLAARLWRTAERQACDIEERLARPSAANPERERDLRMLTMLVRSLRELSAFDAGLAPAAAPPPVEERLPGDVDALRAELARRVEGIRARRAAAAGRGD